MQRDAEDDEADTRDLGARRYLGEDDDSDHRSGGG